MGGALDGGGACRWVSKTTVRGKTYEAWGLGRAWTGGTWVCGRDL